MNRLNSENTNSTEHRENTEHFLKNISHDTGEALGSLSSNIKDITANYTKKGKAYIEEHPSKSLAISAMAGAVVGSIITLVARRRK